MPETHSQPLVSCVMPTYNRRQFVPYAIKYFLRQDYENKELIIIDDGPDAVQDIVPDLPGIRYYRHDRKITLGAKLNMACQYAEGSIIVHWDDDDWYAPWRLNYQVQSLQQQQAGVCGINKLLYYDFTNRKAYQYIYPPDQRKWLLGSSLCYTKQLWRNNRFADIDVGMDGLFVWNTPPQQVSVLDNHNFSVHMIHGHNVSPKQTTGSWWHSFPEEEIRRVMGADWHAYTVNGAEVKNIYACLVHESEDCIRDLVHNLHFNDPSSVILLYNGSMDPHLIPADIANAVVHPKPFPAKHGYLHKFALDCMEFSLNNFDCNCLTIVDSDQLSIRPGYSKFLSPFISPGTGMFSNKPERVDCNNKTNAVALQAFREYDLWKPLLHSFEKGEEKFVHWTFWPSTVFMADAARDLVKIFKGNATLQHIMQHSKIWASEEVILPTLVRLLGYEIRTNPCSYEFVKYKLAMSTADVNYALRKDNAYWIHPVARTLNDPVRAFVREQFNKYKAETQQPVQKEIPVFEEAKSKIIVDKISKIEGWLSAAEAELLAGITEKAFSSLAPPHVIAEVGSYHGKSTVVFGSVIKEKYPDATIVAMDPHDGKLGAADAGLKQFPPSLDAFKRNIQTAGITDVVEVVHEQCRNVPWNRPVSVLFIDGLHDYMNVSRDFMHFSDWIIPGGFVAFHDYADYFPGVKVFVNELSGTLQYKKIAVADSLIVLQKL
jgi:glycosyltransferase involved in cell wall biosynthesis